MTRIRSPGYPSISIVEAIDLARKIFDQNRHNGIDREAAMRDMGYRGVTGHSSKMIADLHHFGLVEKAGKGGVRVAEVTARILHPHNPQERAAALQEVAYSPALFADIKQQWPDGHASENALRAYLMRRGFSTASIQPVLNAYLETYAYLREENATESHRQDASSDQESEPESEHGKGRQLVPIPQGSIQPPTPDPPAPQRSGVQIMAGERIVFSEEGDGSQYLKLVASGDIDAGMLEALEDFVKRQKRRLERAKPQDPGGGVTD